MRIPNLIHRTAIRYTQIEKHRKQGNSTKSQNAARIPKLLFSNKHAVDSKDQEDIFSSGQAWLPKANWIDKTVTFLHWYPAPFQSSLEVKEKSLSNVQCPWQDFANHYSATANPWPNTQTFDLKMKLYDFGLAMRSWSLRIFSVCLLISSIAFIIYAHSNLKQKILPHCLKYCVVYGNSAFLKLML